MPSRHDPGDLSALLRQASTPIAGLDPRAPLDDLEPLRGLVGDARVVALGENAHFTHEFTLLRHRLTRFLVERCGFGVVALESGFNEGFPLDRWIQGEGEPADVVEVAEACIPSGTGRPVVVHDLLGWLREQAARTGPGVRVVGIDIPRAGGSLLPALEPLAEHVDVVDPHERPLIDAMVEIASRVSGMTQAQSAPRYTALTSHHQDALTAGLARLADRWDALEPVRHGPDHDLARWRLASAIAGDHQLRAIAGLYDGTALTGAASSRERFMAATVQWWLDRLGQDTRIVVLAHNAHIQRSGVTYQGEFQVAPMGQHLDRALGDGYVPIGMTSQAGRTAGLVPDPDAEPYGFRIEPTDLQPPVPSSIEAALGDVGLGLVDLRPARTALAGSPAAPDRLRLDTDYLETPPLEGYDAIVHVPTTSLAITGF